MDIVSLTQSKRAEILAYVKPRVSFESYSWIFNVFNDLNKKILFENDEVLAVKVYPMYENLISFFEDFSNEVSASSILFTVYSCALQAGIRSIGDCIENLPEFQDGIDMSDWDKVNLQSINAFDMRTSCILAGKGMPDHNNDDGVWGCGLVTLTALPYLKTLIGADW